MRSRPPSPSPWRAALAAAAAFTLNACATAAPQAAAFTLPSAKLAAAVGLTTCNRPEETQGDLVLTYVCPMSYAEGFSDGACLRLPPLEDDPTLIVRCRWTETRAGVRHAHRGYFVSADGDFWIYEKRRPRD